MEEIIEKTLFDTSTTLVKDFLTSHSSTRSPQILRNNLILGMQYGEALMHDTPLVHLASAPLVEMATTILDIMREQTSAPSRVLCTQKPLMETTYTPLDETTSKIHITLVPQHESVARCVKTYKVTTLL